MSWTGLSDRHSVALQEPLQGPFCGFDTSVVNLASWLGALKSHVCSRNILCCSGVKGWSLERRWASHETAQAKAGSALLFNGDTKHWYSHQFWDIPGDTHLHAWRGQPGGMAPSHQLIRKHVAVGARAVGLLSALRAQRSSGPSCCTPAPITRPSQQSQASSLPTGRL